MTEIKPCPFCGTEWSADPDATMVQVYHNGPCEEWMVFCEGCGTESSNYSTLDEAIAAWNQRVPDPSLLNGLREAREALGQISTEYENANLSHKDYRLGARLIADTTLAHLDTLLAQEGEG